jgi:hypothetical protein
MPNWQFEELRRSREHGFSEHLALSKSAHASSRSEDIFQKYSLFGQFKIGRCQIWTCLSAQMYIAYSGY